MTRLGTDDEAYWQEEQLSWEHPDTMRSRLCLLSKTRVQQEIAHEASYGGRYDPGRCIDGVPPATNLTSEEVNDNRQEVRGTRLARSRPRAGDVDQSSPSTTVKTNHSIVQDSLHSEKVSKAPGTWVRVHKGQTRGLAKHVRATRSCGCGYSVELFFTGPFIPTRLISAKS